MREQEVAVVLSIATLTLFSQSLSLLAVSSRILALGTIPMETELACFLKELFSYLPCSGFRRDSLCELFLSPKTTNALLILK